MVPILPILMQNRNNPQMRLDLLRQTNRDVLNQVLCRVPHPLSFTQIHHPEIPYINILCADGNFRRYKPVLTAWVTDCPRYSDLHHREWYVCFWCECPMNQLGDYVHSDKKQPRPFHNLYSTLSNANTIAAYAEISSRQVP
jgi:hypothetical protein